MTRHTRLCGRTRSRPAQREPLIFIHDREKVVVCWHRLLHLHSVIDCLAQRGSSVCLQTDEPVLLTPSRCHAVMLPHEKTPQSSHGTDVFMHSCSCFLAVNKLGNTASQSGSNTQRKQDAHTQFFLHQNFIWYLVLEEIFRHKNREFN